MSHPLQHRVPSVIREHAGRDGCVLHHHHDLNTLRLISHAAVLARAEALRIRPRRQCARVQFGRALELARNRRLETFAPACRPWPRTASVSPVCARLSANPPPVSQSIRLQVAHCRRSALTACSKRLRAQRPAGRTRSGQTRIRALLVDGQQVLDQRGNLIVPRAYVALREEVRR
jgi:hypothetical protein